MKSNPNSYIAIGEKKLRLRLKQEDADNIISNYGRRFHIDILRADPPCIKLRPVQIGGCELYKYESGGVTVKINIDENILPTCGPTDCEVRAEPSHILCTIIKPLRPYIPRQKVLREPGKPQTQESIDTYLNNLPAARALINKAKQALGHDLDLRITDAGLLDITYMRTL